MTEARSPESTSEPSSESSGPSMPEDSVIRREASRRAGMTWAWLTHRSESPAATAPLPGSVKTGDPGTGFISRALPEQGSGDPEAGLGGRRGGLLRRATPSIRRPREVRWTSCPRRGWPASGPSTTTPASPLPSPPPSGLRSRGGPFPLNRAYAVGGGSDSGGCPQIGYRELPDEAGGREGPDQGWTIPLRIAYRTRPAVSWMSS